MGAPNDACPKLSHGPKMSARESRQHASAAPDRDARGGCLRRVQGPEPTFTDDPDARASYERNVPLGRVARLDDLDGVIAFLATDASSFMTGQAIIADGGTGL